MNNLPFLHTILEGIIFRIVTFLPSDTKKLLKNTIQEVVKVCKNKVLVL